MASPHRLSPQERADDSFKSWQLGVAAWREIFIRKGDIPPKEGDATHARWVAEGPRRPSQLDCVRGRE